VVVSNTASPIGIFFAQFCTSSSFVKLPSRLRQTKI
jgi:hypothetical protein